MNNERPTHTPTPNAESPEPTPNEDSAPPRARGVVTDRLRREAESRLAFARRYYPKANQQDADRLCFLRRDQLAHPMVQRGKRGRG